LPLDDANVHLFAVDRDTNGYTVVTKIDVSSAIKKRPGTDWTLSRMWMAGLLGGVQNV
jgi:hypothetical protein